MERPRSSFCSRCLSTLASRRAPFRPATYGPRPEPSLTWNKTETPPPPSQKAGESEPQVPVQVPSCCLALSRHPLCLEPRLEWTVSPDDRASDQPYLPQPAEGDHPWCYGIISNACRFGSFLRFGKSVWLGVQKLLTFQLNSPQTWRGDTEVPTPRWEDFPMFSWTYESPASSSSSAFCLMRLSKSESMFCHSRN